MNWIHKLFNPHCPHCRDEAEQSRVCDNCEYLKIQIAKLQQENERLLNNLLDDSPKVQTIEQSETPINLNTSRFIPFSVKRQELESKDRQIARSQAEELKKNHNKNIEELEKEILTARIEPLTLGEEVVNAE